MAFPHDAHRALLADFLDALDQDRAPRPSGREALSVHHLIDALLRASAEGRMVPVRTDVKSQGPSFLRPRDNVVYRERESFGKCQ